MLLLRFTLLGFLLWYGIAPVAPVSRAIAAVEDCENCIDDDGDGLIDRADSDCTPPSDGGNAGLDDATAARAIDRCSRTLQRFGAKVARERFRLTSACLRTAATCVQTRASDTSCPSAAATRCTRYLARLAPIRAALDAALARTCSEPDVTAVSLLSALGLGFSGEDDPCQLRGVSALTGITDVASCVQRQHDCVVDRAVAATAPRAAELLALAGQDVAGEFPCLPAGANGGGAGVAAPKRRAIRKCDTVLQRAAQKMIGARIKTLQSCSAAAFTCVQARPGDAACRARLQPRCAAAFATLDELDAALESSVVGACDRGPLDASDLTADEGLGFEARGTQCAALGIANATSAGDVAACLVRELRCRSDQLVENETPRLRELIGDVPSPATTPTPPAGTALRTPTATRTVTPQRTPTRTPTPAGTATHTTAASPSPSPTAPAGFWDPSNIPAAQNVMMFKFLNRTNGQYDDAHVFWSVSIGGVKTTHSIAEQPLFDMPANSSGRIYVYLGKVGQTPTDYYDFLEYTIGPTQFNGNTTRVDAFGIKLAHAPPLRGRLRGDRRRERRDVRGESRDDVPAFHRRRPDGVQAARAASGALSDPESGLGGFGTGGQYANYYAAYIDEIWSSNGLTIPKAGPNGSGLGAYPNLSAAIYRHTAGPNTFSPDGKLLDQSMWANPATFYLQAPADYYAKFWHDNAIDGKAYGFPYDDVGGYSTYVSHKDPQYMLVAIGW